MSLSLLTHGAEEWRRCTVAVEGLVQGVGFRPFVYRLARHHGLRGSVRNALGGVLIDVEGDEASVARFLGEVVSTAPPVARPRQVRVTWSEPRLDTTEFRIDTSHRQGECALFPAPDLAVCGACLSELRDPTDRRHGHPFLSCTGCGPRFSIIRGLPYDRERTSMAGFSMCDACRAEYEDADNRRFHAEPIACPACGPRLAWRDPDGETTAPDSLRTAALSLRAGRIVAVKGVGGYHLACDATNAEAVAELRRRKAREAKPLAIMVRNLDEARRWCRVSEAEAGLLVSTARPIVLLSRCPDRAPARVDASVDA